MALCAVAAVAVGAAAAAGVASASCLTAAVADAWNSGREMGVEER